VWLGSRITLAVLFANVQVAVAAVSARRFAEMPTPWHCFGDNGPVSDATTSNYSMMLLLLLLLLLCDCNFWPETINDYKDANHEALLMMTSAFADFCP
jgi:hypothetical protein